MTANVRVADHPADPLASSFAVLLKRPLTELYAVLWRAGVLEIVSTQPAPQRHSQEQFQRAAGWT